MPVRDPEALAGAVSYLIEHPEAARRMGQAGQVRARSLYDENKVLERQWRVFRSLVRKKIGREIE